MGFFGTEGKFGQRSTLSPGQIPLQEQLANANMGGSFAPAADYWRGMLSNDSADFDQFAAPEVRRFQQETIPGLSEQFAGMGAGGLSSSGFRNAAIGAGTDLNERLAGIRAQLRQNAAQGLVGIGQMGMQPTTENYYQPGKEGWGGSLLKSAGSVIGGVLGSAGGPIGTAIGSAAGNWLGNQFSGQQGQSRDLYQ